MEVISNGIGCYLNNRKISKGEALFGDTIFIYGLKIIYLGKYIAVNNLYPEEQKNYKLGFRYDNVSYVKVSMVDEEEAENATAEELRIDPTYGPSGLMSAVILGYFFL